MLNALLTYGPMFACYVNSSLFNNRMVLTVAAVFELMGGLFNMTTYAVQSRYFRTLVGQSSHVHQGPRRSSARPSFNVDFSTCTTFEIEEYVESLTLSFFGGVDDRDD